jgi:hypothetical protein
MNNQGERYRQLLTANADRDLTTAQLAETPQLTAGASQRRVRDLNFPTTSQKGAAQCLRPPARPTAVPRPASSVP